MIGWKGILAGVAIAIGVGLAIVGEPGPAELAQFKRAELDAKLDARSVFLDPAEVLGLMRNKQVRLHLLDVRDERDFNLFHLTDAKHVALDEFRSGAVQQRLHPLALKIVISNDEARAIEAWRLLEATGIRGSYILEGGANLWVDVFRDGHLDAHGGSNVEQGDDFRHHFVAALGGRHSFSRPHVDAVSERSFEPRAELLTNVKKLSGGCGG